jgi:hypothetical protein
VVVCAAQPTHAQVAVVLHGGDTGEAPGRRRRLAPVRGHAG